MTMDQELNIKYFFLYSYDPRFQRKKDQEIRSWKKYVRKQPVSLNVLLIYSTKKNPGCPPCFRYCQMLCQISKPSHKVAVVLSYPSVPLVSGGHTSLGFWSLSDSFQIYPLTHTGGGTARRLKQWTEARQSCIQSKLEKLSLQWLSCCYLPKK